jgi:hypothetical protein
MQKKFLRTFAALFLAMKPTTSDAFDDLIVYAWENPTHNGYHAYPKFLGIKGELIRSEYIRVSPTSYLQKWWFTAREVNKAPKHSAAVNTQTYDAFQIHWYVANLTGQDIQLKVDTFYLPWETGIGSQPGIKVNKFANVVEFFKS